MSTTRIEAMPQKLYPNQDVLQHNLRMYQRTMLDCVENANGEIKYVEAFSNMERVNFETTEKRTQLADLQMLHSFHALANESSENQRAIGNAMRHHAASEVRKEKKSGWIRTAIFTAVGIGLTAMSMGGCNKNPAQKIAKVAEHHKIK